MNILPFAPRDSSLRRWGIFCFVAALLAGCEREEIRVYTAPKDVPVSQSAQAESSPHGTEPEARPRPQLSWKLPQGWKEAAPNEVSLANFDIPGAAGGRAQVSITQLGNFAGREAMIINMWRKQAGQPELGEEEALKQFQPVEVGGEKGNLFEVSGTRDGQQVSIVTAMLNHPDGTWFCKLAGDTALVAEQKPTFITFLKSIQIKEGAAATPAVEETTASGFNWTVPKDWKAVPAGEMQAARFSVAANNGKADVFVSVFPSDTGGTLANVNRWRKQLGLGPVEEKDLAQSVAPLDPANPQAVLVDLTNGSRRLTGAIVPRDGKYWFYKLLGDAGTVGAEKDAFATFAKSKP